MSCRLNHLIIYIFNQSFQTIITPPHPSSPLLSPPPQHFTYSWLFEVYMDFIIDERFNNFFKGLPEGRIKKCDISHIGGGGGGELEGW